MARSERLEGGMPAGLGSTSRSSGGITGNGGKNVNPVYKAVPEKTFTLNKNRTKVVIIDKNGNVTSRPFNRKSFRDLK